MNQTLEKEWIMTDDGDCPQWVKQINETTFSVVIVDSYDGEGFFAVENTIDVSDYTRDEIEDTICPFFYRSLEELGEGCDQTEQNQIIAECLAEIELIEGGRYEPIQLEDVVEEMESRYGIVWDDWGLWYNS